MDASEPNQITEELRKKARVERLAYSIPEAADMLGLDYFSVYRLVQRGKLKACRALRGKFLITRAELDSPTPRRVILVDHAETAQSVEGVEQAEITSATAVVSHLGVGPRIKRLDDRENVLHAAMIDEIDRSFIVEHRMACMQPKPGLVGRIKVRKAVDDIAKFGDDSLRA